MVSDYKADKNEANDDELEPGKSGKTFINVRSVHIHPIRSKATDRSRGEIQPRRGIVGKYMPMH